MLRTVAAVDQSSGSPYDFRVSLKSLVAAILFALLSPAVMASAPKIQNRCGWFDNPTPGNAWLHDKEGEWTIAIQSEYEAQGHWNPDFDLDNEQNFVRTGSSYGYGCVCMKVKSNPATKKILEVLSIKMKNLSDCRKDQSLKEPKSSE